jgi:hypothetical protein
LKARVQRDSENTRTPRIVNRESAIFRKIFLWARIFAAEPSNKDLVIDQFDFPDGIRREFA